MREIIQQLLAGALGTCGFALLFNVKKNRILFVMLGGVLSWGFYLIFAQLFEGVFIPSLIASLLVALYAEVLARLLHAPSTPFFALSVIPLIPGKALFYTMTGMLTNDLDMAFTYGAETAYTALGIGIGMSIVWAMCDFSRKISSKIAK